MRCLDVIAKAVWTGGGITPTFTIHCYWRVQDSKPPPPHHEIGGIYGGKGFQLLPFLQRMLLYLAGFLKKLLSHPSVIFEVPRDIHKLTSNGLAAYKRNGRTPVGKASLGNGSSKYALNVVAWLSGSWSSPCSRPRTVQ